MELRGNGCMRDFKSLLFRSFVVLFYFKWDIMIILWGGMWSFGVLFMGFWEVE